MCEKDSHIAFFVYRFSTFFFVLKFVVLLFLGFTLPLITWLHSRHVPIFIQHKHQVLFCNTYGHQRVFIIDHSICVQYRKNRFSCGNYFSASSANFYTFGTVQCMHAWSASFFGLTFFKAHTACPICSLSLNLEAYIMTSQHGYLLF